MGVGPEEIADVRFTPVRIREGYDMAEVDGHLDRARRSVFRLTSTLLDLEEHNQALASAAESGQPPTVTPMAVDAVLDPDPAPLPPPRFATGRLREGYDMAEVDRFLEKIETEEARLRREIELQRSRHRALVEGLPEDQHPVYSRSSPPPRPQSAAPAPPPPASPSSVSVGGNGGAAQPALPTHAPGARRLGGALTVAVLIVLAIVLFVLLV